MGFVLLDLLSEEFDDFHCVYACNFSWHVRAMNLFFIFYFFGFVTFSSSNCGFGGCDQSLQCNLIHFFGLNCK